MYAVVFYISYPRISFATECKAVCNYLQLSGTLRMLSQHCAYEWTGNLTDEQYQQLNAEMRAIIMDCDIFMIPAHNRRKQMLVADMDSTMIVQECIDELALYAGVKKQVAQITHQAMEGRLDFRQALAQRVALLKGLPITVLQQCLSERILSHIGAKSLIATLNKHGVKTVLLSGGFDFFVSAIAQRLGFDEWRANTLPHDNHVLLGTIAEPILDKHAKKHFTLQLAQQWNIAPENIIAVGDGANDLEMLQAVGLGVAYRAKPIVAQQAKVSVNNTDLRALLYMQGYTDEEILL